MQSFFKVRVRLHQKRMQRYLKYVFNDHFALLMTFLLGAAGLYYSNILKELTRPFALGQYILLAIWVASLSFGRYTTLTQPADQVFLLPKETQMRAYLKEALRYSCYVPFGIGVLIIGAGMPLYVVSTNQSFQQYFILLATFCFLKLSHLYVQQLSIFQVTKGIKQVVRVIFWVLATITYAISLFVHPIMGCLVAVLILVISIYGLWLRLEARIDWENLIDLEQKRMYRMYRFINLFTDVPQISASVKRRKYLDGLFKRIKSNQKNTYFYLYTRRFLRGTEFSGLFIRLLFIGSLILLFISEGWLACAIGMVFSYLIGFQLLPMYNQFEYLQTTQMYPISKQKQVASFKKLILIGLVITTVVYGVVGSIHLSGVEQYGLLWGGLVLFDGLFYLFYVPTRLKKISQI